MIAGQLQHWRNHPGFARHPVWTEAFEWIERNAAGSGEGFFPLESEGCLVRVMSYPLKGDDEAKWESHRHTIDLQYTIDGAEGIRVHPVGGLEPQGEYIEEKDFQYHEAPAAESAMVKNLAGHFCVLFPQDAHQPQLHLDGYEAVRKLVVKIPVAAVQE